jgi:hypothetical protein
VLTLNAREFHVLRKRTIGSGHRVIGSSAIESQKLLIFDHPMARSPDDPIFRYSPLGTRFNAFFTVPRSIMIFSCSSVIA